MSCWRPCATYRGGSVSPSAAPAQPLVIRGRHGDRHTRLRYAPCLASSAPAGRARSPRSAKHPTRRSSVLDSRTAARLRGDRSLLHQAVPTARRGHPHRLLRGVDVGFRSRGVGRVDGAIRTPSSVAESIPSLPTRSDGSRLPCAPTGMVVCPLVGVGGVVLPGSNPWAGVGGREGHRSLCVDGSSPHLLVPAAVLLWVPPPSPCFGRPPRFHVTIDIPPTASTTSFTSASARHHGHRHRPARLV